MFYTLCYHLVFIHFCHFYSKFITITLSAVRLGRQTLWLVLVECQLVRPANVLGLCEGFNRIHKQHYLKGLLDNKDSLTLLFDQFLKSSVIPV